MREINNYTKKVNPDLLEIPEISQAIELAQESAYTQAELNAYDAYWVVVSTEKTLMSGKYREGLIEGLKEGPKEGLANGLTKGRAEGREETILEVAQNLKAQGLSSAFISSVTGLPAKVINELSSK